MQGGGGGILAALTGATPTQIAAMARAISRILDTLQQNLVQKAAAYKNKVSNRHISHHPAHVAGMGLLSGTEKM